MLPALRPLVGADAALSGANNRIFIDERGDPRRGEAGHRRARHAAAQPDDFGAPGQWKHRAAGRRRRRPAKSGATRGAVWSTGRRSWRPAVAAGAGGGGRRGVHPGLTLPRRCRSVRRAGRGCDHGLLIEVKTHELANGVDGFTMTQANFVEKPLLKRVSEKEWEKHFESGTFKIQTPFKNDIVEDAEKLTTLTQAGNSKRNAFQK